LGVVLPAFIVFVKNSLSSAQTHISHNFVNLAPYSLCHDLADDCESTQKVLAAPMRVECLLVCFGSITAFMAINLNMRVI
jgi:hypothetical protein